MAKNMIGRVAQKIDSSENWDKATGFVPMDGEFFLVRDADCPIVIGDGSSTAPRLRHKTLFEKANLDLLTKYVIGGHSAILDPDKHSNNILIDIEGLKEFYNNLDFFNPDLDPDKDQGVIPMWSQDEHGRGNLIPSPIEIIELPDLGQEILLNEYQVTIDATKVDIDSNNIVLGDRYGKLTLNSSGLKFKDKRVLTEEDIGGSIAGDFSEDTDGFLAMWDGYNECFTPAPIWIESNRNSQYLGVDFDNIEVDINNFWISSRHIDLQGEDISLTCAEEFGIRVRFGDGGYHADIFTTDGLGVHYDAIATASDIQALKNKIDNIDIDINIANGAGDNSLVINEGFAIGNTSIAGGTTDVELIEAILGEGYAAFIREYGNQLSSTNPVTVALVDAAIKLILDNTGAHYTVAEVRKMLTLVAAKAEGDLAIALGANVDAFSALSMSLGYGNTSGAKGYYLTGAKTDSAILQVSNSLSESERQGLSSWIEGDRLLVIAGGERYLFTFKYVSDNKIYIDEYIPFEFTERNSYSSPNENTIINLDKPEAGIVTLGWGAISIGALNKALGSGAYAHGYKHLVYGDFGAAFGQENEVDYSAFSVGIRNKAINRAAVAFGDQTTASGINAFSAGENTVADGRNATALGNNTQAKGNNSTTEGYGTIAEDANAHAEGYKTQALKEGAHSEGKETVASAKFTHTEGEFTVASARAAHAEGGKFEAYDNKGEFVQDYTNEASGEGSHVEGCGTKATKQGAHAEGVGAWDNKTQEFIFNEASGLGSHVEGRGTKATRQGAHSEGLKTQAIGEYAHAQGVDGIAEGRGSMVAGYGCYTNEYAKYAIAAGDSLLATAEAQAVFGKYNATIDNALFIIGNGTERKRANIVQVHSDRVDIWGDINASSSKFSSLNISDKVLIGLNGDLNFYQKGNEGEYASVRISAQDGIYVDSKIQIGEKELIEETLIDILDCPEKIGEIETALDRIIAIQNRLIGGTV